MATLRSVGAVQIQFLSHFAASSTVEEQDFPLESKAVCTHLLRYSWKCLHFIMLPGTQGKFQSALNSSCTETSLFFFCFLFASS